MVGGVFTYVTPSSGTPTISDVPPPKPRPKHMWQSVLRISYQAQRCLNLHTGTKSAEARIAWDGATTT